MQIDSYVSERRRKQKKRRKYFWSVAVFLAAYLVFLSIVALFVRLPAFHEQRITIVGNSAVSAADITNLLQASVIKDGNLLAAPDNGLKAMLGFTNMLVWPGALPTSTVAVIPQLADVSIAKDYFLHTITVTVAERQPFAVWCLMAAEDSSSSDACYWIDDTGTAFQRTLDTQGGVISVIHDYAQGGVALGGKVLPADLLANLLSVLGVLRSSGVGVEDISIRDLALQEVDVTTSAGPLLKFSLHFPADNDLAILGNLAAKPDFGDLQYVDFTVQNRVYYK
ncbi:MAG TPA: hypothetical protein VMT81_03165 [Candidatus Paceibacterota bacterium]|nr:hypothetical protein [Candidatus Paceibacterota bacterium]